MKTLKIEGDGAHWGLTDWYPEVAEQIEATLIAGEPFTTGWYSSKKEIASACISCDGRVITAEVSVSDDFDTEGLGRVTVSYAPDIDVVVDAVERAWGLAEADQRDNMQYKGWKIIFDGQWVETYLVDVSGLDLEAPPGDDYHQWGFQDEYDLPDDVRNALEQGILAGESDVVLAGAYRAEKWEA